MFTIVIGAGLTTDHFGTTVHDANSDRNLGRHEIERLSGIGRRAGDGPLPAFLAQVHSQNNNGCGLIIFNDSAHPGERAADLADAFYPFRDSVQDLQTLSIGQAVSDLRERFGIRPDQTIRALIVGGHTEREVTSFAISMRRENGAEVAVCPSLTGSIMKEAHYHALRYTLPSWGIKVLQDIDEVFDYVGIDSDNAIPGIGSCRIEPASLREAIEPDALTILKRLVMHWDETQVKSLSGGYSGSLLFLAEGRQQGFQAEPLVIKIDNRIQMRRELSGYYRVKDLMGKHVPAFGTPVTAGEHIGISMDLATMEGAPQTLQDLFEACALTGDASAFLEAVDKMLSVLIRRLYSNTARTEWVVPYRQFGLHTEQQQHWLADNARNIISHARTQGIEIAFPNIEQLQTAFQVATGNGNGIKTEVALSHGDLNFQNVIRDDSANLWFIDWTHADDHPLVLDFAKLENDLKFVLCKDFYPEDIERLRILEEFLATHAEIPEMDALPDALYFVNWDLRFRGILTGTRAIRRACFDCAGETGWLSYRIALLRYASHTLSFAAWTGRGECEVVALLAALQSVESLSFDLLCDPFHMQIRAQAPHNYPERQVISIDEAPWDSSCEHYDPPYFVAEIVLSSARSTNEAQWAHPEDWTEAKDVANYGSATHFDEHGRPLNPAGRTGLRGRGNLGRWGENRAVAAIMTRPAVEGDGLEFLVCRPVSASAPELPRGLKFRDESSETALLRVLRDRATIETLATNAKCIYDDQFYDRRQTDHAWVNIEAFLIPPDNAWTTTHGKPVDSIAELDWWPLNAKAVNRLGGSDSILARLALERLGHDEGGAA